MTFKKISSSFIFLIGMLLLVNTSSALTIESIVSDVSGRDMQGMNVSIEYSYTDNNGTTDYSGNYFWNASTPVSNESGVVEIWGSLLFGANEDTYIFGNDWALQANSGYKIQSFTLSSNFILFDIFYGSGQPNNPADTLTPQSLLGWFDGNFGSDLIPTGTGYDSDNNVTYSYNFSNAVLLKGEANYYNDLWASVNFDFGTDGVSAFNVEMDTDRAVPEPATMVLFGLGLLGFGIAGRKKIFKA